VIRGLVVDDHVIVRSGLEQLLATADDIEIVATAADGEAALASLAEHDPDVVLMDLSMPGMDGVEATRRITSEHPGRRVLVLTSYSDRSRIMDALAAGADGYLLKHAIGSEGGPGPARSQTGGRHVHGAHRS
jgi:DNA-binding NarL/FixJ family response regulator